MTSKPNKSDSGTALPSADLINFRFDLVDKQLEKFAYSLEHFGSSAYTRVEGTALQTAQEALANRIEKLETQGQVDKGISDSWNRKKAEWLTIATTIGIVAGALISWLAFHKP